MEILSSKRTKLYKTGKFGTKFETLETKQKTNNCERIEKARKANYLGGEIFEDGGEVDGGAGAYTLGVFSGLQKPRDTADGELKAGLAAPRGGLLGGSRS